MRFRIALTLLTLSVLAACGGQSADDAAALKAQARADSVAMADAMFDASIFDTLTWDSDAAKLERGAVVYRSSCEKCHGNRGGGNGEVAMQFELEVPSFQAPDWQYRGDVDGLRHRVFVGYQGAMPNWGLHVKYREIDAVSAHIATSIAPAETAEMGG